MSTATNHDVELRPIGEIRWRQTVRVRGHVRDLRVRPQGVAGSSLECALVDDTGGITLVFLWRTRIAGLELGRELEATGMVSEDRQRLVLLNPLYTLIHRA